MPLPIEPIRKKKLSEAVLDRLISAIMSKEFPPNAQLPSERELMLRFGVGRPAIREAMQQLQQMGLLRISHGERARVISPTPEALIDQMSSAMIMMLATNARGLDELKQARILMETGLVKQASARRTGVDMVRLERSHQALLEVRGAPEAFLAADLAFHGVIADIAGNALVASVLRAILDWLSRFKVEMVSVKGAEKLTIEEHERILAAVRNGQPESAGLAMQEHLGRANDLYRQLGSVAISEAQTRKLV
jgi:GntR family transcriptional regulator, sialic acid-inducible nan operon repressor